MRTVVITLAHTHTHTDRHTHTHRGHSCNQTRNTFSWEIRATKLTIGSSSRMIAGKGKKNFNTKAIITKTRTPHGFEPSTIDVAAGNLKSIPAHLKVRWSFCWFVVMEVKGLLLSQNLFKEHQLRK